MKHRVRFLILSVLTALLIIGVGIWAGLKISAAQKPKTLSTTVSGISFEHAEALEMQPLSNKDKTDKIVARLASTGKKAPQMLVTIRRETGLKALASDSKQPLLDMLITDIDKVYPSRFKDYKKVSSHTFNQAGRKAAEVVFTYKSPEGSLIEQRVLILMQDDDTAVYTAAQARASEYTRINKLYFSPLLNSVKL